MGSWSVVPPSKGVNPFKLIAEMKHFHNHGELSYGYNTISIALNFGYCRSRERGADLQQWFLTNIENGSQALNPLGERFTQMSAMLTTFMTDVVSAVVGVPAKEPSRIVLINACPVIHTLRLRSFTYLQVRRRPPMLNVQFDK